MLGTTLKIIIIIIVSLLVRQNTYITTVTINSI